MYRASHPAHCVLTVCSLCHLTVAFRWHLLADYRATLNDLDRSFSGFNAIRFLKLYERPEAVTPVAPIQTARSVNDVLGSAPRPEKVHLPPKYNTTGATLNKKQVLFNDIVDLCRNNGACFSKAVWWCYLLIVYVWCCLVALSFMWFYYLVLYRCRFIIPLWLLL